MTSRLPPFGRQSRLSATWRILDVVGDGFRNWDELRAWVAERFNVVAELAGGELVTFRGSKDGVVLGLRRLDTESSSWALFCVKIGAATRLGSLDALASTFEMAIGSFFVHRDSLGIGQKLPVAGLTPEVASEVIEALATTTKDIRSRYMQADSGSSDTYEHFSD
jgi:hypothetical protein